MANEAVLIVDDDAAIRKLLTKVVEGNGYQAFTASNGKEAYPRRKARKFRPDPSGYYDERQRRWF